MEYLMLILCCIQALTNLVFAVVWKADSFNKSQRLHCLQMILRNNNLSLVPIPQTLNVNDVDALCDSCRMMEEFAGGQK